jgi:hypothetical protein
VGRLKPGVRKRLAKIVTTLILATVFLQAVCFSGQTRCSVRYFLVAAWRRAARAAFIFTLVLFATALRCNKKKGGDS